MRITNFLDTLPVRKQTALKDAAKELTKIKRMLQAYALARPAVRIQFRVLKAKSTKGDWLFSPKPNGTPEDAIALAVGRDCASQCDWSIWQDEDIEMRACLPRLDADTSKISNIGSFIAVNSRPVSTSKGTLKQIVSNFKEKLRNTTPSLQTIKIPFMFLNIVCPPDAYDANVEPAKDDVLFVDSAAILKAFASLLDTAYPFHQSDRLVSNALDAMSSEVEALVARNDFVEPRATAKTPIQEFAQEVNIRQDSSQQPILDRFRAVSTTKAYQKRRDLTIRRAMYSHDEEDLNVDTENRPPSPPMHSSEEQDIEHDISISNPWTIAKMNAPIQPRALPNSTSHQQLTPSSSLPSFRVGPPITKTPVRHTFRPPLLPTPENSSPVRISHRDASREQRFDMRELAPISSIAVPPTDLSPVLSSNDVSPEGSGCATANSQKAPRKKRHTSNVNAPFKQPRMGQKATMTMGQRPMRTRNQPFQPSSHSPDAPSSTLQLADQETPPALSRSDDRDIREMFGSHVEPMPRHAASTAQFTSIDSQIVRPRTASVDEILTETDQVAFVPLQRSHSNRIHRTRSAGLPLERVPPNSYTQNLNLTVRTSITDILTAHGKLSEPYDLVAQLDEAESQGIVSRLSFALLRLNPKTELVPNFDKIICDAFKAAASPESS